MVSLHPGVTREQVQETCGWMVVRRRAWRNAGADELEAEDIARPAGPHRGGAQAEQEKRRLHNGRGLHLRLSSARRSAASAARCPRCGRTISARYPRALVERNHRHRLAGDRRRHLRLRQPGRRGQPQRRAHGAAARRAAAGGARLDRQPPLRLRHGCRHHRCSRHQGRRGRADDRRRRRIRCAAHPSSCPRPTRRSRAMPRSTTPPSAGASSTR